MKTLFTLIFATVVSSIACASEVPVMHCLGTEPFWSIKTDAKGFLSMNSPVMEQKKFYSKTSVNNAAGMTEGFAFQIKAQDMAKNELRLNVVRTECSDGMSEEVYPYTVLVDVDNTILFGCCR